MSVSTNRLFNFQEYHRILSRVDDRTLEKNYVRNTMSNMNFVGLNLFIKTKRYRSFLKG